jgi:ABC-type glycerol-3-phosphate transport system substrate-binding protein
MVVHRPATQRGMSRRDLLKAGAAAGAGAVGAGLAGNGRAGAQSPSAAASGPPLERAFLEVWHQDWPPLNALYQAAVEALTATQPNVRVRVTPLGVDTLRSNLLNAMQAGSEPEVSMAYAVWLVDRIFEPQVTPVVPVIMTAEQAAAITYPASLAEGARGEAGDAYELSFFNGMGGAIFLANADHLDEAGIDLTTLGTWQGLVDAARALVKFDAGNLTRAGLSMTPFLAHTFLTGITQLGGTWFDPVAGTFDLTSDAAIDMTLNLDDLLKVHRVDDLRFEPPSVGNTNPGYYGNPDGFSKGLSSITTWEPAGFSGIEALAPDLHVVVLPVPTIGDANPVVEVPHGAVHVFSRRLRDDPAKAAAARAFVETLVSPAVVGSLVDAYAGSVVSPTAGDASLADRRWAGTQTIAHERVWPNAHHEQHHIPNWAFDTVWPNLQRVFQTNAAIEVVLADMEAQSNTRERQIRDSLGI